MYYIHTCTFVHFILNLMHSLCVCTCTLFYLFIYFRASVVYLRCRPPSIRELLDTALVGAASDAKVAPRLCDSGEAEAARHAPAVLAGPVVDAVGAGAIADHLNRVNALESSSLLSNICSISTLTPVRVKIGIHIESHVYRAFGDGFHHGSLSLQVRHVGRFHHHLRGAILAHPVALCLVRVGVEERDTCLRCDTLLREETPCHVWE